MLAGLPQLFSALSLLHIHRVVFALLTKLVSGVCLMGKRFICYHVMKSDKQKYLKLLIINAINDNEF